VDHKPPCYNLFSPPNGTELAGMSQDMLILDVEDWSMLGHGFGRPRHTEDSFEMPDDDEPGHNTPVAAMARLRDRLPERRIGRLFPCMAWYVRFRFDGTGHIDRHPTREAAIEAACRLIRDKCEVLAIGAVPRETSLTRDQIAVIYRCWAKTQPATDC
jgi:hypothetical protein